MYNLNEDLAGFQFNLKDFRETYGDQKITFKNGELQSLTQHQNENGGVRNGYPGAPPYHMTIFSKI